MYAVVGCSNCNSLWVVEGNPKTTQCPRCASRHRFRSLKRFVTTDDPDEARQARAAMLADRGGHGEAFADLDPFAELERTFDRAGVDAERLERSGVDVDAVAAAGERAERGRTGRSREETVRAAIRELDEPSEADVVAYAGADGVPEEYVREALAKLARAGEVSEHGGRYRLL